MSVFDTAAAIVRAATPTPADFEGDPNLVFPGVIGFVITFLVALATVFLLIDMNRRIRRTRYRAEVREQLDAERAEADAAEAHESGINPTGD